MANQEKVNEEARKELSEERKKLGFNTALGEDDEDDLDRGDLEEDENSDEENEDSEEKDSSKNSKEDEHNDSEDSDDDSDEDSEDDEDEDFESEKDKVNPKKVKVFEAVKKYKKELRVANEKIAALESKLPDDFQEELEKFTKEVGVEDPESLKKIVDFLKKFAIDKNANKLQAQIEDLKKEVEAGKTSKPIADEFPEEWKTFRDDILLKEFPNASKDELKTVRSKMELLAKSKNIGGKVYIDEKSGKEVLDPYPLDYIYYKNKDTFAELMTGKKIKGMETARTAGITTKEKQESTDLEKPLPKNASGDAIRKIDMKYRNIENKMSGGLHGDGDNTI